MSEMASQYTGPEGYDINIDVLRLDFYRLLSLILAHNELVSLAGPSPADPFYSLIGQFADDEVTRLLISTAIMSRLHDERMAALYNDENELIFVKPETNCGTWVADVDNPQEQTLPLREACNKIIHAKRLELKTEQGTAQIFHIRGTHGNNNWEVTLNLIDYVRCGVLAAH